MKKIFLLVTALVMSAVSASAIDWHYIDTDISNLNLFIDVNSIKPLNSQECIYAIRYSSMGKPEQVAYIKYDFYNNKFGVIQAGDYSEETYRPRSTFADYHVFMKQYNADSLLAYAGNYARKMIVTTTPSVRKKTAFTPQVVEAENIKAVSPDVIPVSHITTLVQKNYGIKTVEEYVNYTSHDLDKLWIPPKSGRHTQAIVIVQIAPDGSLMNYKFAKKSGDEATDRSIMSTIEQNVPYAKFPSSEKNSQYLNIQFVFEYKQFKKTVI